MTGDAANRLIMALPNGRILGEVMPLLRCVGIEVKELQKKRDRLCTPLDVVT